MAERDRRRYADEQAAQRPSAPTANPSERGLEELVLPLQRSAGNHAVGAMIAARGTLARQPGGPPTAAPAKESKKPGGGGPHVIVNSGEKTAREFDAISVQLPVRRSTDIGGGGKKPDEKVPEEIHVSKEADEHSPILHRMAAEGRPPLSVEIRLGGMTIRLKDALISSYSVHPGAEGRPPVETLTFNGFMEVEFQETSETSEAGGTPSP